MSKSKLQFTDDQFIDGLRNGNNEILSALYKKYYNIVLKFIVNNSGTEEAAQDIYQETVIVLYENAQKPQFSLNCQLQTYIYSVAKRLWLKQLKKNGKTFLSLIEPTQWGKEHIGTFTLNYDNKWIKL